MLLALERVPIEPPSGADRSFETEREVFGCAKRLMSTLETVRRLSFPSPISLTFAESSKLPSGVYRFAFEAAVGVNNLSGTWYLSRGELIDD